MADDLPERLFDLIPDGMTIWEDDDELGYFADRDLRRWMKALGHDRKHTACCTSCGCCVTCVAQMFHGALVASVIRELDKLGALREPVAHDCDPPDDPAHDSPREWLCPTCKAAWDRIEHSEDEGEIYETWFEKRDDSETGRG